MKCKRCGSIFRPAIILKDGRICIKCYKELGFNVKQDIGGPAKYTYDEIKDGYDAMMNARIAKRIRSVAIESIQVKGAGRDRELNATDNEHKSYDIIKQIINDAGLDTDKISLVRKSDNYLSVVAFGSDLCRFRCGQKTQWFMFPFISNEKIKVEDLSRLTELSDHIVNSYNQCEKYK